MTIEDTYYLIVRPLSEDPDEIAPIIKVLAGKLTIDTHTLTQSLTGSSLHLLKSSRDKAELEKISKELKKQGVPSIITSKSEIRTRRAPLHAKQLKIDSSTLTLLDGDSRELLSLDSKTNCLIVLSTPSYRKLIQKKINKLAYTKAGKVTVDEAASFIFRNNPVMDIYVPGAKEGVRIDSRRFNFTSMGELNKGASALNFPCIIEEIKRVSSSVLIETGYGRGTLPFIPDDEGGKKFHKSLSIYSSFVYLATADNIFAPSTIGGVLHTLTPIPLFGGVLWGGPVLGQAHKKEKGEDDALLDDPNTLKLPLPPSKPLRRRFRGMFFFIEIPRRIVANMAFIKRLGPPAVMVPLASLTLIGALFAQMTESGKALLFSIFFIGIILFIHSFILLQRKRAIENCPTSTIKTLPMGVVEIKGRVQRKYFMRSPFSLTDCVHYSYKVYKVVRTKDSTRTVLVEWGSSGNVPFYVEDDTGRILINPKDAILHAGRKSSHHSSTGSPLYPHGIPIPIGGKVVETVVAEGTPIYVLGFAHRLTNSARNMKAMFLEKLRAVKAGMHFHTKYDKNNDGRIDDEEFEVALRDVRDKVLKDTLENRREKDVAIGAHPSGGLFYISDKHEEKIVGSMGWKVPLFFTLGTTSIVATGFYILQMILNKDILEMLGNININL